MQSSLYKPVGENSSIEEALQHLFSWCGWLVIARWADPETAYCWYLPYQKRGHGPRSARTWTRRPRHNDGLRISQGTRDVRWSRFFTCPKPSHIHHLSFLDIGARRAASVISIDAMTALLEMGSPSLHILKILFPPIPLLKRQTQECRLKRFGCRERGGAGGLTASFDDDDLHSPCALMSRANICHDAPCSIDVVWPQENQN